MDEQRSILGFLWSEDKKMWEESISVLVEDDFRLELSSHIYHLRFLVPASLRPLLRLGTALVVQYKYNHPDLVS